MLDGLRFAEQKEEMGNSIKRTNPGDAANIFIRCFLSDISELMGGFSKNDLHRTMEYFNYCCPYTGDDLKTKFVNGDYVLDHLIPHNREYCGLHVFGNIIPTSRIVNSKKASLPFEQFIMTDTTVLGNISKEERMLRICKLKEFQRSAGYEEKILHIDKIKELCEEEYQSILTRCKENKDRIKNIIQSKEVYVKEAKESVRITINKSNIINTTGNYEFGELEEIKRRIAIWSSKYTNNHHKIIAILLEHKNGLDFNTFSQIVGRLTNSQNPGGAIRSLMTSKSNAYGKVFIEEYGLIKFAPEILESIKMYSWKY